MQDRRLRRRVVNASLDSHRIDCSTMASATHEFVTADMRGLKAALVARAHAERVSVSVIVRRAVERELQIVGASSEQGGSTCPAPPSRPIVKMSIRLTSDEAEQFAAGARGAGLSRGAFLADLIAGGSASAPSPSRADLLAALNASCAELSTLRRNLRLLASLLREGQVQAALEYRQMLDTLEAIVRSHLQIASAALADVWPPRQPREPTGPVL